MGDQPSADRSGRPRLCAERAFDGREPGELHSRETLVCPQQYWRHRAEAWNDVESGYERQDRDSRRVRHCVRPDRVVPDHRRRGKGAGFDDDVPGQSRRGDVAGLLGGARSPDHEGFPQELAAPTTKPSSFLTPARQVLTSAPAITVFDQNLQVPTVHMWNLTIARELPQGFILQTGYLGKRGTRLFRGYDLNQLNADPILEDFRAMQRNVNSGCNAAGASCPAGVAGTPISLVTRGIVPATFVTSANTAGELQQNAAGTFAGRLEQTTLAAGLRPNQQFGIITYLDAGGDSYYHAFQTTLRRRFSNGFQVMAAYTLSKSIDNQSVDPVASSAGGG